jgi:enoyl-[acyl-carrier protein] reductase I
VRAKMDYFNVKGKKYLVFGVANKKSVAYFIAQGLISLGAEVILSVLNDEVKQKTEKLFPGVSVYTCDLEKENDIKELRQKIISDNNELVLNGIVHSVAFANFSNGLVSFFETEKKDFLQAVDISCFSLVSIVKEFKDMMDPLASVVTISISTTRMASENYGYMGPVKAALESTLAFLAKSFSSFSEVRFNAVCAGLLKTSASAGIPGYIDSYLYAEKATLRHKALKTQEVADTALFLLSPRSSGINAQRIIVDAGMEINYFDKDLINSSGV